MSGGSRIQCADCFMAYRARKQLESSGTKTPCTWSTEGGTRHSIPLAPVAHQGGLNSIGPEGESI